MSWKPALPGILLSVLATLKDKWTSLVVQTVECLPTMRETWVQSQGWEDLLEKEMATLSSILAWKISWTEEPGGLQSMGSQRVGHSWATNTYLLTYLKTNTPGSCPSVLPWDLPQKFLQICCLLSRISLLTHLILTLPFPKDQAEMPDGEPRSFLSKCVIQMANL